MSQLKQIDVHVKKLYQSVTGVIDSQQAKQIVGDLGAAITASISEKDIDYIGSTMFNAEYGIMCTLRRATGSKDSGVCSAVTEILSFLCTFMPKRKKYPRLQLYASDLVKQCNVISRYGNGNSYSRSNAIELLTELVDKKNKFDVTEFDIPNMYKRYSDDITLPKTRLPGGVQGKIFILLGTIAKNYADILENKQLVQLKRWCFDILKYQIKDVAETEVQVLSGALRCLNNLVYCDNEDSIKRSRQDIESLFTIILMMITKFQGTSRYDPVIAALALFRDHTDLFSTYLVTYGKALFDSLNYWASHHNNQTYKHGLGAYEQFIRQLSLVLYHNIGGQNEKRIFMEIMDSFYENLQTADNLENFYKVSVSIRGVGYFAKVCSRLLKKEEVDALRNSLIKISDWFYSDTKVDQQDYTRHLPAFIKAYTLFAAELDPIPIELMQTLHRMCDTYILGFIAMSGYHRRNGVFNIQSLFSMLYNKGEGLFRNFLNEFFEKTLITTCTDIKWLDEEERPAYIDYIYFWKTVLNNPKEHKLISENKDSQIEEEDNDDSFDLTLIYGNTEIDESANLSDTLYDSFLLAVLKLIKTFNLKLKNVAEDDERDGESQNIFNSVLNTLQPINRKDFMLFQNLVDFWCTLLNELDNKRLSDWVHIVSTAIIDQSVVNPLVSGFYKMMSEVLAVCEKRQFFLGCKEYYLRSKSELKQESWKMPKEYASFLLIREYLKEVWHRLQQFTDELLASCLRLVLAYPIAFFELEELIIPLEKALRLGITYHPLATIAMNSLDKLLDPKLGYDINSEFLSRILPCINEYLLVGVVSSSEEEFDIKKKKYKIPSAAERRYQNVRIKMTSDQLGIAKNTYSGLPDLQLRMMQFLGRLGGKNKQLLLDGKDSVQESGMLAWDPVKRLKLRVPFRSSKVDIYLDEFLPRICELAESSPDRQVKVAACELLHGLALFMIGNAAFQAKTIKEANESDYHKLYLKIFPVMLRLAIDPDQVARDMFRLLYAQIIHWLTNNAYSENPETMALLTTCLEAACNTDAGLRDYGAECIQEFVKWSIKQTSRSSDAAMNIKSLLKRLYNLMTSPSSTNRFGASLVFNRIYRLFREESVLVNEYTLEILGQLFISLKMSEADHPSIGTRDQIIEAISHIKRIIRTKVNVFLDENTSRRPFVGADGVDDLKSAVAWAFTESGKTQRTYAKVCITFFVEFVKYIPGCKSPKDWLSKESAKDINYYVNVFEANGLNTPSLEDDHRIMAVYTNWIKRLNSALDGYIWLIERDILSPYELLLNPESMLILAVDYFIRRNPYDVLEEKLDQSIIEKNKILSVYTHISVRLIYFFDLVFKSPEEGKQCYDYMNRVFSNLLYNNNFTSSISNTLLLPKHISETIQSDQGNAATNSGVTRIFNIAKNYIVSMSERNSVKFMESLTVSISEIISKDNSSLLLTNEASLDRSSLIEIIQTIDGLKLIQSLHALDSVCQQSHKLNSKHPETAEKFCLALFDQYLRLCQATQDPLWAQILGSSLVIAFTQTGFSQNHVSELLGFSGKLESLPNAQKLDIYQKHGDYIYECMAYHFKDFSSVLGQNIDHPLTRPYFTMFLEYLKNNRLSQRRLVFKFSDYLVQDPSFLNLLVIHSKTNDQLLDLVSSLKLLYGADPGIMSRSKRKPIFDILWKAFMNFLDRKHPFVIKNSALDLLPIYISLGEDYALKVTEKLNESIVQEFPIDTENMVKGTTEYNEYISYLDKLLGTMATFKSTDIFKLLIVVFVQEKQHIHEETIKKYLESFTNGLGLTHFMKVVQYCFTEFKNEHHTIMQRRNLGELIISLSVGVNEQAVVAFYEKNLDDIMSVIQRDLTTNPGNQVADWSEKADCFRLIQGLFDRLPKRILGDPSNSINVKWMKSPQNKSQKKLVGVILHSFGSLRNTPILPYLYSSDNSRRDAQFLYNKSVYRATASIVLCIAEKLPQASMFFLQDRIYNTYPWEYVIDTTQDIFLGIQWDKPMVKSKLNKLRAASGYASDDSELAISYMASAALTGSSFTQPSLSEMVLEESRNDTDELQSKLPNSIPQDDNNAVAEATRVLEEWSEEDDFEFDILNENSIMKPLTEVVKKIHLEISPPSENTTDMPGWIKETLRAFQEASEINIQLHIAKLITNYPVAFEKYASSWLLPLIALATKGYTYGLPINYFVQDLCVVLIIWGRSADLPSPRSNETRRILFAFVEYLIKNAYHDDQSIMRSNIQIIKGVFENWGKYIPVPTRAIYDQFTHTGDSAHKNIVGLQVVSIVLLNDGNPYDHHELSDLYDLPEVRFYTDMANNINYSERRRAVISEDAAELMGMVIHYMKEKNNRFLEDIKITFTDKIQRLFNSKRTNMHILKCMSRLCLRDTKLASDFISVIIMKLHQYGSAEILLALRCIAACWNGDDMIYHKLTEAGLERMISSRDEQIQIAALKVLNKIFDVLKDYEIDWIIKRIALSCSDHTNVECRNLYYSFLKKAYQISQKKHFALKNEVKAYLFRGLIDKNKNTAQSIYNFIEQFFGFTDDINLTLQKITSELYMPDTEDIYLLYSTRLVLSNTKKSYDFDQPIFDKPLPNARFDADYQNINTSWQNASSMMPLFRDTQSQSLNPEDVELELRRTQSLLEFSITQGNNRTLVSTFNPETEIPIDELNLNSPDSAAKPPPISRKQTEMKNNPYHKKRFIITPPGASNRFHSSRNEKLEKKLRNLKNTQKEILEKKVTLSRSYRVGELPDVQINFKDLLLPLEVLASADYNISRLLYSSLVVAIINADDKDTTGYKSKIVRNIQSNIINSTLYFTPTIGSFLRIFFDLDITYQPENLVRTASSNSSNHHIGIALLEKQLEISAGSLTNSKRKYKDDNDDNDMELFSVNEDMSKLKIQWTDLSLLYKEIDEPDIFQKLYLNNVATQNLPKEAINAEIGGEYAEAYNNFGEALQEYHDQPYEAQLWTDQMLYCHTQLIQWDEIAEITETRVDANPVTKLWELGSQNPYFDYFIKSHSKFSVMVKRESNLISEFFNESSINESRKEYLNKYYACDWSTVSIYDEQYDLAIQTIPKSYNSLLTAWTTLHPLAHTSRLAKLCQLERTVEIEDYLKLVKKIKQQDATPEHIKNFFETLSTRYPDMKSDSIAVWDDVIDSRFAFIYDIKRQNIKLDREDLPNFDQYAIDFLSLLTNAALEQNNLDVLTNIRSKFLELGATQESQLSMILFSQKHGLDTRDPIQYKFLASTFAYSINYEPPQKDTTKDAFNHQVIIARSFDIIKQQLVSNPTLFEEMKELSGFKKAARKTHQQLAYADSFVNYLENTGFEKIEMAGKALDETDALYTEYLWKFGNYCDNSLRLLQDSSSTLRPDIDPTKYCEIVMRNYFKAIDKGHIQAIENFPRLLELLEVFPEMGPLFKECSLQLDASWKFIRWIPQLVSFIESPIAKFIFPCLTRIAEDYPKALYYPFNMSFEHYEWTKDNIPAENRQAIEKIRAMIHSPSMEEFSVELQRLTNPDHIVKDFIGILKMALSNESIPENYLQSTYDQFNKLLLDPYNSRMGSIPSAFNARHRGGLSKVFGKNGKRLFDSPAEVVDELTKYYTTNIDPRNGVQERYKSGGLLKSFSPWLATFKSNDFDEELEIPGQYDGFSKPYPELHAKVASFGTQVLVMESIRKPKRLTINGTDEKEYNFLVKGGEDLRLDQRIEQLFGVMNNMIKKNAFCSRQSMQIATYKVIPMSLSLGMIEWVNHTKPVKSCIETQEPNIKKWRIVRDSYNSWIVRHAPRSKNIAAPHFAAYADSRSNIEKNFDEISERLPPTLLRDFVLQLASSPEAFLFLRKDFAYSLACISIFGYILGIGDRHLDNFLIDLKSGRLIPIDFGHAFGSATEHLAIPEVVPFRLTRQLVGVLDPLGVSGILETAMVNVLQAVKDEKELLLNIMNVFIKDPLLDWKKAATSESKNQTDSIGTEQGSWYPQRKMDIVKRKLDGDNPALIAITEIENGHSSRSYCKDIVSLAKGDPDHDIRAQTGSSCQNTTNQVQCLINLATDKCVLGVMYGGWMPFV